jgi:hypothetical protein
MLHGSCHHNGCARVWHAASGEEGPSAGEEAGEPMMFVSFITAGLVPPFSDFFLMTLEEYRAHMEHLTPKSVVILAVCFHIYEMFVQWSHASARL